MPMRAEASTMNLAIRRAKNRRMFCCSASGGSLTWWWRWSVSDRGEVWTTQPTCWRRVTSPPCRRCRRAAGSVWGRPWAAASWRHTSCSRHSSQCSLCGSHRWEDRRVGRQSQLWLAACWQSHFNRCLMLWESKRSTGITWHHKVQPCLKEKV